MQCMSCTAIIEPRFISAIKSNTCPCCSNPIMDEASKLMLDELRAAMAQMPNDPDGLAGWLLSNFRMEKIGSGEPEEFYQERKKSKRRPRDEDDYEDEEEENNDSVNEIYKRAGLKKLISGTVPKGKKRPNKKVAVPKNKNLAKIAELINSSEDIDDKMYGGDEEDESPPEEEYVEEQQEFESDEEAYAAMEAEFKRSHQPQKKQKINRSDMILDDNEEIDADELERAVSMIEKSGPRMPTRPGNKHGNYFADRLDRVRAQQEALENGDSLGDVTPNGNGPSFRRAG